MPWPSLYRLAASISQLLERLGNKFRAMNRYRNGLPVLQTVRLVYLSVHYQESAP